MENREERARPPQGVSVRFSFPMLQTLQEEVNHG